MALTRKHLPYHVPKEQLCCPHCKGTVEREHPRWASYECEPCGIKLSLTETMQKRMESDDYPHERWQALPHCS